jgi:hypothetical protein
MTAYVHQHKHRQELPRKSVKQLVFPRTLERANVTEPATSDSEHSSIGEALNDSSIHREYHMSEPRMKSCQGCCKGGTQAWPGLKPSGHLV